MNDTLNSTRIREFFDRLAEDWDVHMIIEDDLVARIFDNAQISEGKDVLDVACGTGVLFAYYRGRKVRSVTGIELSPEMAKIAETKHPDRIFVGDASVYPYPQKYDVAMVYNAFPHIADREAFIRHMHDSLKEGGILSVAHGMSERKLKEHHRNVPEGISGELPGIPEMVALFEPYFEVLCTVSDERMYQVTGRRKAHE